ncbi:MAG: 23S rRNA (uracil(1939)-C(5))-methyltransferase RlmD [Lachnospiraceae bacterium]|nr:23S rRNA (uracil(1939)-C(5))-methyltransferase RlmD [Lachnospiraceae bacterium]
MGRGSGAGRKEGMERGLGTGRKEDMGRESGAGRKEGMGRGSRAGRKEGMGRGSRAGRKEDMGRGSRAGRKEDMGRGVGAGRKKGMEKRGEAGRKDGMGRREWGAEKPSKSKNAAESREKTGKKFYGERDSRKPDEKYIASNRKSSGERGQFQKREKWEVDKKPYTSNGKHGGGEKKWQSRNGEKPKADRKQYAAEDRQYASRKETGAWKGSDRERERATDEWGKSFQAGYKDIEAGKKICRAFGECGGCQMLHLPYKKQLKRKMKETAKLLEPYVRLEEIIGMEQPEHYRNKVNAAFTHDRQGKPLSGVYKEGTHYIIPIKKCILENEKADAIIATIRELLPSFKIKTYDEDRGYGLLRHVMVRIGQSTGQIMVVLVLSSPILPSKNNFVKALLERHPEITTIVTNINERKTSMVLGENGQVIYGKGYIEDVLCGITFRISPKSFYQVNAVQTEKLYKKAVEYAGLTGKEVVLDAYCGIGTIGMVAAGKADRVIGVELNEDAIKDAAANAKRNKIKNIDFYQKDAGEFMIQLAEQGEHIDTVFMDPPRTGSDEIFLDSLVKLKPKKVVYISCNPETLARDLKYMTKRGYWVTKGVCLDMFPFCGHVECVIMMQYCGKEKKK